MTQYNKSSSAWAFPIRFNSSRSGPQMISGQERIIQALTLLLKTHFGERPLHPDYGSELAQSVFAQLDLMSLANLREDIATVIQIHETRINLINIEFDSSMMLKGQLHIVLDYETLDDGEQYQLRFPFSIDL